RHGAQVRDARRVLADRHYDPGCHLASCVAPVGPGQDRLHPVWYHDRERAQSEVEVLATRRQLADRAHRADVAQGRWLSGKHRHGQDGGHRARCLRQRPAGCNGLERMPIHPRQSLPPRPDGRGLPAADHAWAGGRQRTQVRLVGDYQLDAGTTKVWHRATATRGFPARRWRRVLSRRLARRIVQLVLYFVAASAWAWGTHVEQECDRPFDVRDAGSDGVLLIGTFAPTAQVALPVNRRRVRPWLRQGTQYLLRHVAPGQDLAHGKPGAIDGLGGRIQPRMLGAQHGLNEDYRDVAQPLERLLALRVGRRARQLGQACD